jgi:hypothetical protein
MPPCNPEAKETKVYTLVDCSTDLIYGPYETFKEALDHTEAFERWEIVTEDGDLVDWCNK